MIYCKVYDMNSPIMDSVTDTDELQLFALLSLHETPRKLLSKEDHKNFHCHFALPLPRQVILFAVGDWEGSIGSSSISVEVSLESEQLPKKIGTLTKDNKALCWQADWGKNFTQRSIELMEEDRMAKLILSVEGKDSQKENQRLVQKVFKKDTSPKALFGKNSTSDKNKSTGILTPKNRNAKLDDFWGTNRKEEKVNTPPVVEPKTPLSATPGTDGRRKRTPRSSSKTPTIKRRKALNADDFQDNTNSSALSTLSSPKADPLPATPSTPCSPTLTTDGVPSSRWGHAVSVIADDKAVVIGGQGAKFQMAKDSVWLLTSTTAGLAWSQPECKESIGADRRLGHSVCYEPEKKTLYVYGGSKNKRWFSDVHKLDTTTWTWSTVETVGKAPTRAYHSCTLFRGELWIIGGVYPNPDPQPDGCSNDLHVLNLSSNNWYMPITGGNKPCPRSGHSVCLLDDKLVLFGGWDAPTCFNDVFILDMTIMEFTKPSVTGMAPSPRSWHTAVPLPGNKMLINGGFDGIHTTDDTFILDLGTLTWSSIQSPPGLCARAGHSAFYLTTKSEEADQSNDKQILVFGGGDNKGGYFNDLVDFMPIVN